MPDCLLVWYEDFREPSFDCCLIFGVLKALLDAVVARHDQEELSGVDWQVGSLAFSDEEVSVGPYLEMLCEELSGLWVEVL